MSWLTRLIRDQRGATLIEFAMIAPALLMIVIALFDIGYNYYVQTQLQGAIQKAARDSGIENAGSKLTAIDARVAIAVHRIAPDAKIDFNRKAYSTFSEVSQPEDFTDVNNDGVCNDDEPFEDANNNGQWDLDRGVNGIGSARDAVLYTVDVEYTRAFNAASFVGLSSKVNTRVATVLRNQPYALVNAFSSVGHCI